MVRTVADETPSPAAVASADEATGSPDAMNSRTSAASTRPDRSFVSCMYSCSLRQPRRLRRRVSSLGAGVPTRLYNASPAGEPFGRASCLDRDLGAVDLNRFERVDE